MRRTMAETTSKLASTVADRIVADIAELDWPTGEVIGSEPELLEQYGVSRAVFREAVRLVEHWQVASMRRGPGGGLVVTEPQVDAVVDAVVMYLAYVGVRVEEVFEARLALEASVAELAPGRATERDIIELRELEEREASGSQPDPRELHALVARITKNPGLEFFVDLLNRLTYLFIPDTSGVDARGRKGMLHAHSAITEALIAGDEALTRQRMRTHLQAEGDYLKRKVAHTIDPRVIAGLDRAEKRAQSVAWEIFSNITEAGWPVGTIVGSEADLMERYDCSRAVLREAVRLLEHHEVARMRRGVGGGLVVAEPSISAATQAVALHLERNGIDPTALFEVRTSVEMAVVDLAVQRIDAEGKQLLEQALAVERASTVTTFGRVGHDLHAVLGQISGNRVLELLTLVLVRLTRLRQAVPPGGRQQDTSAVVSKAHGALVAAIVAGDRELSRRRMRKHLDALSHWVR